MIALNEVSNTAYGSWNQRSPLQCIYVMQMFNNFIITTQRNPPVGLHSRPTSNTVAGVISKIYGITTTGAQRNCGFLVKCKYLRWTQMIS